MARYFIKKGDLFSLLVWGFKTMAVALVKADGMEMAEDMQEGAIRETESFRSQPCSFLITLLWEEPPHSM